MKILQVSASYKPAYIYGGPAMSVSKLSEEMVAAGAELEVLTTTANGTAELNVEPGEIVNVDGVKVIYFKRLTKDHTHYSPTLLKALKRKARDFDVVHIHAWWNLVSVLSCWVALKRGVPVVVSPRGTLSAYSFGNKNNLPKKLIHNLLGKRLLKQSYIHATSEREKMAMEALVQSRGVFNIPNFIALPDGLKPKQNETNDVLKLLFFSRIEEKKGLEILFDALAEVAVPYQLTIAGDGEPAYVQSLKALAERKGIAKYLTWIGFINEDKFDILQQHDLMVLPSYDENFGNVVIESLSVGTAVLISENVGLASYVKENDQGWVCANNAESFSKVIGIIRGERSHLEKIRQQAPVQVRKDFDDASLRKRYLEMYDQIVNNG